ncbi:hypothetical protein D3C84_1263830 [compost metagenome]
MEIDHELRVYFRLTFTRAPVASRLRTEKRADVNFDRGRLITENEHSATKIIVGLRVSVFRSIRLERVPCVPKGKKVIERD